MQLRRMARNARGLMREITSTVAIVEAGQASYAYAMSHLRANSYMYKERSWEKARKQPHVVHELTELEFHAHMAAKFEWVTAPAPS